MGNDGRVTFAECLLRALLNTEMVEHFDRLHGTNLCLAGTPLQLLIDFETGRFGAELRMFVAFVKDCVWDRLPPEVRR